MHEAMFYEKITNNSVHCYLCPHHCHLKEEQLGICQARRNGNGKLYSLNYGEISSIALDPIEKKPIKLFKPGSAVLSVGSFGCNFRCSYCQNWSISQVKPDTRQIMPEELADLAEEYSRRNSQCIGVAYTYSEPAIWYEYVLDSAIAVKEKGLANVLVTNGYIEEKPLIRLLNYIDAINLDIKAYTDDFYKSICRGSLERVLENAKLMAKGSHLEVTTLIIPEHDDRADEIAGLAKYLAAIDPDIPLHLSRYFPNYQMDLPATPMDTMHRVYGVAKEYLNNVFLGNV